MMQPPDSFQTQAQRQRFYMPSYGQWQRTPDGQFFNTVTGTTYADSRLLPPEARLELGLDAPANAVMNPQSGGLVWGLSGGTVDQGDDGGANFSLGWGYVRPEENLAGLSPEQIAQRTGLPISYVNQQANKGRLQNPADSPNPGTPNPLSNGPLPQTPEQQQSANNRNAPPTIGGVQTNIQGNPTAGERAGGINSTLPGGNPAVPGVGVGPSLSSPPTGGMARPPGGSMPLPRFQLPQNVDYGGSAGSIFGAYAGTAGAGTGGYNPVPYTPIAPSSYQTTYAPGGAIAPTGFAKPGAQFSIMSAGGGGSAIPQAGTPGVGLEPPVGGIPGTMAQQVPSSVSGPDIPQNEGGGVPPDPGGGAVYNPTTGKWEAPGATPTTGGGGGTAGGSSSSEYPGLVRVPKWGADENGNPVFTGYEYRNDPTYQSPSGTRAPAGPGEIAGANRTNLLTPAELDQIIANTGLTTEQQQRMKALLPGELLLQGATIDQIKANIDNAIARLGLDTAQFNFDKAYKTAALTGQIGDQATLDRVKTMGFDQYGNPTLDTRKFQFDTEIGYANSARNDLYANIARAGSTGYDEFGTPTYARELGVSQEERANLVAAANVGNQAAQIRLQEIAAQENARQFDTSFGLTNDIQRGNLSLQQQEAERQWQQNPSSLFERVYANRNTGGFAAPQPQQQTVPGVMQSQVMPLQMEAGSTPGFQPPAQVAPPGSPARAGGALTYNEINQAGALPPAVAAATAGARPGSAGMWQPAGGMPRVSDQGLLGLSPTERGVFDASLRATGNSPEDYQWDLQRRSALPTRSGAGFSAPSAAVRRY